MSQKINQNHPRYRDIQAEASRRFDQDFNQIDMDVVEAALEKAGNYGTTISEQIQRPSFSVLADEWLGDLSTDEERELYEEFLESEEGGEPDEDEAAEDALAGGRALIDFHTDAPEQFFLYLDDENLGDTTYDSEDEARTALGKLLLAEWKSKRESLIQKMVAGNPGEVLDADHASLSESDFYDWLEANKDEEITEHYDESEHYPMWSTLFEAKDSCLVREINENIDALYDLGIGVIDGGESDLNVMLFISGAGYDFYEKHWIPMYQLFGWIDPSKYPDPAAKLTGCGHCGKTEFTYPVLQVVYANHEDNGDFGEGCKLSEPSFYDHQPTKKLRCTYCGTEHDESNFNWTQEK